MYEYAFLTSALIGKEGRSGSKSANNRLSYDMTLN
jgi:hypothetical protein